MQNAERRGEGLAALGGRGDAFDGHVKPKGFGPGGEEAGVARNDEGGDGLAPPPRPGGNRDVRPHARRIAHGQHQGRPAAGGLPCPLVVKDDVGHRL